MNKLSLKYQSKWATKHIFDSSVIDSVSKNVQLHKEVDNVLSSAASCMNVLGNLNKDKKSLIDFLNYFDLNIADILAFPTGASIDGEMYDDNGYVIFEWIGPRKSPIKEENGGRGRYRTSIDAFLLAEIDGKVTQLLIEWKFTESYNSSEYLQKFGGKRGIERLRRYSSVLKNMRSSLDYPFNMKDEDLFGLYDLGYEPLYQLMRMTLLAKKTTPLVIGDINVEDYRIVHLTHSKNDALNIFTDRHSEYTPGLLKYSGKRLHEIWSNDILSENERIKFKCGHWDKALDKISDGNLKTYLIDRYQ